jgi:hypothetical protein
MGPSLTDRQCDHKCRACAWGVLYPKPATMRFYNSFGNGQAQSNLPVSACIEGLHDQFALSRADRLAVIDHPQIRLPGGS